jgi:hypothetical protein
MTGLQRRPAPSRAVRAFEPQKVDPPGGTTGRVGFGTEVDEAPVPDANPRQKRFRAKWYSGSREENASNKKKRCQGLEVVWSEKRFSNSNQVSRGNQ